MMSKIKLPLITTLHGSDVALENGLLKNINQWVLQKSSAVTTVSHALQQRALLLGAAVDKTYVIPMGVNTDLFCGSDDKSDGPLLFVGRLISGKGVDVLLKAMVKVIAQFPEQRLVIVGDGSERIALEQLCTTLQIANNVAFVGAQPHHDLPTWYRQASIFVSPTLAEGFGLTLAEAMACRCAVVVSDLPAVRDVVEHEKTGLCVTPGDENALALAIMQLLNNDEQRKRLAQQGYEKAHKCFSQVVLGKQYAALFDQVLARA